MLDSLARKIMDDLSGSKEILGRAALEVIQGRWELYYLILDKARSNRERWTRVRSSQLSQAYWVYTTTLSFGKTPGRTGGRSVSILLPIDKDMLCLGADDENLFAACALNLSGTHVRRHGQVSVAYLAYTEAWGSHDALVQRLDVAISERNDWRKLWLTAQQGRVRQLKIPIPQHGAVESSEKSQDYGALRVPSHLAHGAQVLLGKALVIRDPDEEELFTCWYLIRSKSRDRGQWVEEPSVDAYYRYAYTMLAMHYTGRAFVPPRRDEERYVGFLFHRVSSIDRSVYRSALARTVADADDSSTDDSSDPDYDSDVTDPPAEPALGLTYSSDKSEEEKSSGGDKPGNDGMGS